MHSIKYTTYPQGNNLDNSPFQSPKDEHPYLKNLLAPNVPTNLKNITASTLRCTILQYAHSLASPTWHILCCAKNAKSQPNHEAHGAFRGNVHELDVAQDVILVRGCLQSATLAQMHISKYVPVFTSVWTTTPCFCVVPETILISHRLSSFF